MKERVQNELAALPRETVIEQVLDALGGPETGNDISLSVVTHGNLKAAIAAIPDEFKGLDEAELRKRIKPSATLEVLRMGFWAEFARVQNGETRVMITSRIHAGICSPEYFNHYILSNRMAISWITCPPHNYLRSLEAMLDYSMKRMWDLLRLPVQDEQSGKVNVKMAELQFKLFQHLEARLHGAIAHNVNVKQLSLSGKVPGDSGEALEDRFHGSAINEVQDLREDERKTLRTEIPIVDMRTVPKLPSDEDL